MWPRPRTLLRLLGFVDPSGGMARAAHARVRMQVEEIEPRILHSADFTPGIPTEGQVAPAEIRIVETPSRDIAQTSAEQQASRRELVIVDTATPDYQALVDDIVAQAEAGRAFEVLRLDSGRDGLAQITEALAGRDDIGAIHLISHGADGTIRLGASVLDKTAVDARRTEIESWARALTADADILIYGCDVAESQDGRLLVDALARLTGADVAASVDTTGHATYGGDWLLEYRYGSIETAVAISASGQDTWKSALTSVLTQNDVAFSELDDHEVKSGQSWGQSFRYDSAGATYQLDRFSVVLSKAADATPGQSITVSLRSSWGGAAIVSATLSSDLLGTSEGWVNITLNSPIALNDNQTYYIRVDSTGDGKVYVGADSSGTYAGGDLIDKDGVAQAGKDMAFRVIDLMTNTAAPVLSGANAVATIVEDFTTNSGTLVSSLIAARVTDADAGAATGIAVTAVDNTNGTWEYTRNGGTTWTAFGTPTVNAARLLAADANTSVRFVPNANWNGTVANGITFRAWDQTNGTAGGTADTVNFTVREEFNVATSYAEDEGTSAWVGGWVETSDDSSASAGQIRISSDDRLRFNGGASGSAQIYREVNLAGATSATLTFKYWNDVSPGDISVQVSSNGGASWSSIYTTGDFASQGTKTYSFGAFTANTRVRFSVTGDPGGLLRSPGGYFYIDDVQIAYSGSAIGGTTAFSSATASSGITVTAANDAPVLSGAANMAAINEDTVSPAGERLSMLVSGRITDVDAGAVSGVAVVAADNANGTWQYSTNNKSTWNAFGAVGAANARLLTLDNATYVRFVPNANWNGTASFTFRAWDQTSGTAGSTADVTVNGGTTAFSASTATSSITITSVNDAPVGANKTIVIDEGTPYTFVLADFGFTDPNDTPANTLLEVKINTLPVTGTLTLNNAAVLAGQWINPADISGGGLVYAPGAGNGTAYASLTFKLRDSGGGADTDTNRTITFDVLSVNNAPVGSDGTVTTNEDTPLTLRAVDFGFTDPGDTPANSLAAVKISSLPTAGTLTLRGGVVNVNDSITLAELNSGDLVFTPLANANGAAYATFRFQVRDDGGTANGGADLDTVARTLTIAVTAVNDAPGHAVPGAQNSLSNTPVVFSTANGNAITVSDVDAAGAGIQVTLGATNGLLTLSGTAGLVFSAGTGANDTTMIFIGTVADVNAALDGLRFDPTAAYSGPAQIAITTDDLGNSGAGGARTASNTVAVNVAFVNSAPVLNGAIDLQNVAEDDVANGGTAVSALIAGQITDIDPGALAGIAVTAVVNTNGVWQYSLDQRATWTAFGAPIATAARLLAADGNTYVRFVPNANWNGTVANGISFRAWDQTSGTSGGTADVTVNGLTTAFSSAVHSSDVVVTPVNDTPVGANKTLATNEDMPLTLTTGDFGFSDPNDSPAHTFAGVRIAATPLTGTLQLRGTNVSIGQSISFAEITNGDLVFTPALNASGLAEASFGFQVEDSGGAFDPTARTITFDVAAVNDAPTVTSAGNVAAIYEDDVANPGTEISELLAVYADNDVAAASGIAVVGVNDSNGTWQYTIDNRTTWLNFGRAAEGSARLLAADGNTFVRFVPNANWNGTVANGLTFRAWDQTVGVNGGVAPTIANPVVLDNFSAVSYTNQNGTANWSTQWVDADGNPAGGGKFEVNGGKLAFTTKNNTDGPIYRGVDLSFATSATLSFKYTNPLSVTDGGQIVVEAWNNATSSYENVGTFSPANAGTDIAFSADISTYMSANTRIQFRIVTESGTNRTFTVDDVQIAFTAAGNGGSTGFSTNTVSSAISVLPVNDAPRGTTTTLTTDEDAPVTLTLAHFGFSDPDDAGAHALAAVKITSLPTAGTLKLGGNDVVAGDFVTRAQIMSNSLVYTPLLNANGLANASFTFQVQDDGGTANGGIALDQTARTMTFNVNAVADAPTGTDNTVTATEDTTYKFVLSDFGFGDAADSPANAFTAVTITSLPSAGTLWLGASAVTAAQSITVADIVAGNLVFRADPNANGTGYATFTFQVQDDGAANTLDAIARTMTIDVTSVNDAPQGTSSTVTINEDAALALKAVHFGFSDTADAPNAFLGVQITSLPAAGTLTFDGAAVVLGQSITSAELAAGKLVYRPAANAHGAAHASFTFRVQDDGGGTDTDTLDRTLTLDVTSVNDRPVGADHTVTIAEDASYAFARADFGYSDPRDTPANAFAAVRITSAPAVGALTLDGVAVYAGQTIAIAQIDAGNLVYTPGANANGAGYASFGFQVQDDGGGASRDATARTMTMDVTAVNDAPVGADATVTATQDTAFVFSGGMFAFADAESHGFAAVKVSALPLAGTLTVNGAAVNAGDFVSVAAISAGQFSFVPAAGASGTSYAIFLFQVQDDGPGGALDASVRSMTVDVTAVRREIVVPPVEPVIVAPPPTVTDTRVISSTPVSTPTSSGTSSSSASSTASTSSTSTAATTPAATPAASAAAAAEKSADGNTESASSARARGADESAPTRVTIDESRPSVGVTTSPAAGGQVQANVQRADSVQIVKDARDPTVVVAMDAPVLAPIGGDSLSASALLLAAQSQSSSGSALVAPLESRTFGDQLDQVRDGLRDQARLESATVAATAATSMSLSVGYVVWLLRGGALLSTMLSSLPAWRFIDPLPVLGRVDDEDGMGDADDSLESMVATGDNAADADESKRARDEAVPA